MIYFFIPFTVLPSLETDVIATAEIDIGSGNLSREIYGFKLHIPADALKQGSNSVKMKIQACLGGHYSLPDGYELASGVYQISSPCVFEKPLQLTIQHNANHNINSTLSFVVARFTEGTLPYQFKTLSGGTFSETQGTIEIKEFSRVGVALEGQASGSYLLQVYHLPYQIKTFNKLSWLTHISITLNLETHKTVC